jgi:hypothetical protein
MEKEIISKFKEKPKTKTAWQAMHFGLATLLVPPFLGLFAAVIRPIIDKAIGNSEYAGATMGLGLAFLALVFSIYALVLGIRAFRQGERSWVLWTGFIPAMLINAFWIVMITAEFLFPEH